MAQIVYECMFLVDSNRYARDAAGTAASLNGLVEKFGGEILVSRLWNEQKLAYPVKGHKKGVYWLTYFRLESTKLAEFTRACQLNDAVLRELVIKPPQKLAEVLVEHARSGGAQPKPAGETEGTGERPRRGRGPEIAELEVPVDLGN